MWLRRALGPIGSPATALRRRAPGVYRAYAPAASALRAASARPTVRPWAARSFERHLQTRALSTSSFVPRAMLKLVRLPLAGFAAAGGVYTYANYKLDEVKHMLGGWLDDASAWASGAGDAARDAFGAASSSASSALDAAQAQARALFSRFEQWQASFSERGDSDAGDSDAGDSGSGSGGDGAPSPSGGGPGAAAAAAAAAAAVAPEDDDALPPPGDDAHDDLMLLTRKLIEVRNILKTIDHNSEELVLPSIVVIGSQSSGKSSVLEAIVGHEFLPKGNNMVTRRPIELTLVHVAPDQAPADGVVEYGEFPGSGMGKITDFTRIQKLLYDMNMAVPQEECVSDQPIELHIYSPHVPDLSMIDLPGYVQLSSMDQPDELREKISALCDRYIKAPNIVLAVCAADVDLANSPALRASRRVDPHGERTIGVVTKMDLVPPEVGAAILNNNKYPLSLGYVGVVCKAPPQASQSMFSLGRSTSLAQLTQEYEQRYFHDHREHFLAPTRGRHAGVAPMTGTDSLRKRLMVVLEEHMGASLSGVAQVVRAELDDAAYQFKVQYNDRRITPETYVAEVMDLLKQRFKYFSANFGKPEVRMLLKQALDDKVLDLLAQGYWSDPQVRELSLLAQQRKVQASELEPVWQHKLDLASSALTKSGIGRMSTQLVANTIRAQLEQIVTAEPFHHHTETAERIIAFGTGLLRERFGLTADQVENCVKPFKYEVEVDAREWEQGRTQSVQLMQTELQMCNDAYERLKTIVGGRRLRGAIEYITQLEEREARRLAERAADDMRPDLEIEDQNDPTRPGFNAALITKAREARFLQLRSDVLRLRLAALKSATCKAGPQNQALCPEAFLNVVADKLTYTAVMFINIELLAEFFYQFPRILDAKLGYDLTHEDMVNFARENPAIRKHIDLQERKAKLEEVMLKLDDLTRLYHGKHSASPHRSKWLFF